jgi:hypothetical protein
MQFKVHHMIMVYELLLYIYIYIYIYIYMYIYILVLTNKILAYIKKKKRILSLSCHIY